MRQPSNKIQTKWILAVINNRTAVKNEEKPYRIAGYKRPIMKTLKQFNIEIKRLNFTQNNLQTQI